MMKMTVNYFCTNPPKITAKQLYKQLIRDCDKLPIEAKQFYKHTIRQSFKQHISESDPERIRQIVSRALEDSKWILKKVLRYESFTSQVNQVHSVFWSIGEKYHIKQAILIISARVNS